MDQHDITTLAALHEQLHKAMQLEHATLPPYLTALYSIRPGANFDCSLILRAVAVEEMLHLAIVANLLNAVGGRPDLTRAGFVPNYPAPLPDGEDDFCVELAPFSETLIDNFLDIERPGLAPDGKKVIATPVERASALLFTPPATTELRYYSIGDFYEAILDGIVHLEKEAEAQGRTIFTGDPSFQATPDTYYSAGGTLPVVTDLHSACEAIRTIIEQGEGETSRIFDDHGEIAHYYRFDQIKKRCKYLPDDQPEHPTGLGFEVDYGAVYPVKKNIKLSDFPPGSELEHAARSFNEAYGVFLAFLTTAFNGKPEMLLEAVPKMFEFRNWLSILVRNPLPGTDFHAGPTFEIGTPAP